MNAWRRIADETKLIYDLDACDRPRRSQSNTRDLTRDCEQKARRARGEFKTYLVWRVCVAQRTYGNDIDDRLNLFNKYAIRIEFAFFVCGFYEM